MHTSSTLQAKTLNNNSGKPNKTTTGAEISAPDLNLFAQNLECFIGS